MPYGEMDSQEESEGGGHGTRKEDKKALHVALKSWPQFYKKTHVSNKKRPCEATSSWESLPKERKGRRI